MKRLLLVLGAAVVVAGGAYAIASFFAPAEDRAADYTPKNAAFYVNLFLEPSNSQKMALEDLVAKFPAAGTLEEARDKIVDLLDEGLSEVGLAFEQDVEPWLGNQIALFATAPEDPGREPDAAVLIATEDAGATSDAIDKAIAESDSEAMEETYKGIDYKVDSTASPAERGGRNVTGIVGDFMVVGTETAFRAAVDASNGESLIDSDRFEEATGSLTEDRLALYYVDGREFLKTLPEEDLPPSFLNEFGPLVEQAQAGVAVARSDRFLFETASKVPDDRSYGLLTRNAAEDQGLLPDLPGNAWGAFSAPGFGDVVRMFYDRLDSLGLSDVSSAQVAAEFRTMTGLDLEQDVLSWIGDLGLFVQGTDLRSLRGGAVIETRDQQSSTQTIRTLAGLLRRFGAPVAPLDFGGFQGFSLRDPSLPDAFNVVAAERVVIAYGNDATRAALEGRDAMKNSGMFAAAQEALGDGYVVSGIIDIGAVLELTDNLGATESKTYQEDVKPLLDPLSLLVFGSKLEGDTVLQRVIIGVR